MVDPLDVVRSLARHQLIPVVSIDRAVDSGSLAAALTEGGLPCVEITFRTSGALDAIEAMSSNLEMLVGAGTVLDRTQAADAVRAGANFIVSPGFDPALVRFCQEAGVLVIPGIATATELQAAVRAGLEVVKFFPAGQAGGPEMIKALSGPFPQMRFVPTGGIGEQQLADYLRLDSVLAVGGSWLAPRDAIAQRDWGAITARVSAACAEIQLLSNDVNSRERP